MDNCVVPSLSDGIGNRLFQLACAISYGKRTNKEVIFLLSRCKETGHGLFQNIFMLFPEISVKTKIYVYKEITEKANYYEYEEIPTILGSIVISGYRQSYKYFEYCNIVPNFMNAISRDRIQYLNDKYLKDKENLFFIHIRLGDFRILPHHQINVAKYYSNAFKHIPENSKILFFSDDIEFAKQMFPQYEFCEETNEIESLYVMSNCLKGSIVANSTFSYWGSYFAHQNNKNHVAIFPKPLGQGLPYPKDYYPPYAILIDSL